MIRGFLIALLGAMVLAACGGTAQPTTTASPPATAATTPATTTTTPATTTPIAPSTSLSPTTTTAAGAAATTTIVAAAVDSPWDTWTLIYASLDTETHTRDDALVIAASIDDAAVLLSDDYPSLNPGYWVVYAGQWPDRRQAGAWCPAELDPSLSCYPRYLGDRSASLLAAGHAIAQLDGKLVVLDPGDGSVEETISEYFHVEGEFVGSFALDRHGSNLFFSLGFEDSWFSCESEPGSIMRLDLATGVEDLFADGWSPVISPDGRWLAIVAAGGCYPDPEVDGWVVAPGSQVEIYDLTSDMTAPVNTIALEDAPASYDDSPQVHYLLWDADSKHLLVDVGDGTMRRVARDTTGWLSDAPVEFETHDPFLAAVTADSFYVLNYYDTLYVLTVVDRASNNVIDTVEIPGWWANVAVNSHGEALIGGTDFLVLPSGKRTTVEGPIQNLAW